MQKANWKLNLWLLWGMAALLPAFAPLPPWNSAPQPRIFRIEASQYAYNPPEIKVNPGDTVTLELVSSDVVHGLYVDDYGVSVQADPGQTATLTFVAGKPGAFRFRCNVTCGALHPFMIGKLQVGENWLLFRSSALAILAVCATLTTFRFPKPTESGR